MKKNDSRYIIVSCKKDTQLFLCLMRHIINTITLFGKFHILQVYRTRFFCVLPNSVTHLSTCLHMHTFDTVHNGHYTLFSFFLFLFVSFICNDFNDIWDDRSRCTYKKCIWIDSATHLKIRVH